MSLARPTIAEERWLALASRHAHTREAIRMSGRCGSWRCATLLTRCLFFALGLFARALRKHLNLLQAGPGVLSGSHCSPRRGLIARRTCTLASKRPSGLPPP